jgi:hypothetical protein
MMGRLIFHRTLSLEHGVGDQVLGVLVLQPVAHPGALMTMFDMIIRACNDWA